MHLCRITSRLRACTLALSSLAFSLAPAQEPATPSTSKMDMKMAQPQNLIEAQLQHTSSGTTVEPPSTPMQMLMHERAGWTWMLHGNGFVADIQQHATATPGPPPTSLCLQLGAPCIPSTRRGADKLFSTNWVMPMAQRQFGPAAHRSEITLRTMLSLEPATIQDGFYPELFQQGETARGRPIVDGQHPHDFIMELAALYDLHLSQRTLLSLYAAPVGDPAIGPTAYPHRHSASEDPIAALGHHQQDSTHIAFNVLTAGLTYRTLRIEGSGFHGAEPTEARWHFQPSPNGHAVDSYSTRTTFVPSPNWSAQYSIGHITSPEAIRLGENQRRQTASVMYNRPFGVHHDTTSMPGMDMGSPATGNWSNTLLWGQTKSLSPTSASSIENSFLLESLVNFHTRNFAWTRIEIAGRSSELLRDQFPPSKTPDEVSIGHVGAYTLGYDRDYHVAHSLLAAPGAQFTLYRAPDSLASTYGRTPFSAVAFVRFRLGH